jgi:hypothetical protein
LALAAVRRIVNDQQLQFERAVWHILMQKGIEAALEHGAAVFGTDANDDEIGRSRRLKMIFFGQSAPLSPTLTNFPQPVRKAVIDAIPPESTIPPFR